jgi:hypothetical protein
LLAHLRCGNFGELKLAYGVAGVCHAPIITCCEDRPGGMSSAFFYTVRRNA